MRLEEKTTGHMGSTFEKPFLGMKVELQSRKTDHHLCTQQKRKLGPINEFQVNLHYSQSFLSNNFLHISFYRNSGSERIH